MPIDVQRALRAALLEHRLDLTARCRVFGHPALVVGNSRRLWPHFMRALEREQALALSAHPVDDFVERAVSEATATVSAEVLGAVGRDAVGPGTGVFIARYAHRGPPHFPIREAAIRAGFCAQSPVRLTVREDVGLWFGLRALITYVPYEQAQAFSEMWDAKTAEGADASYVTAEGAGPVTRDAWTAVQVRERAGSKLGETPHPCDGCERPCVAAFERASAAYRGDGDLRPFIEVRTVCPKAQDRRYGEAQLMYHYTKARAYLSLPPNT